METGILDRIRTTEEAEKFLEEINLLLASFYGSQDKSFESVLRKEVRAWVSEILTEALSKPGVDKFKFLEDLKAELESFKVLKLAVAFELSEESLGRISDFVRANIRRQVLIELSYQPELIGGVVIIFEGEYRDFSLGRVFEQEFKQNKETFFKMVA